MLHTYLTTTWHLRYPIIGAPMAYVGRGRLARAVSQAGGLGMIGIGSTEWSNFSREKLPLPVEPISCVLGSGCIPGPYKSAPTCLRRR